MPNSSDEETQYFPEGTISFVDNFVEQGKTYVYHFSYCIYEGSECYEYSDPITLSDETKYLELQNYSISVAGTLTFTKDAEMIDSNYYNYEWNPLPTINGTLPDSYEYEVFLGYSTNNESLENVCTSQTTGTMVLNIDEVSTLQEANLYITKKYSENYTIPEVSYNNTWFELDISSLGAGIPTTITAE